MLRNRSVIPLVWHYKLVYEFIFFANLFNAEDNEFHKYRQKDLNWNTTLLEIAINNRASLKEIGGCQKEGMNFNTLRNNTDRYM